MVIVVIQSPKVFVTFFLHGVLWLGSVFACHEVAIWEKREFVGFVFLIWWYAHRSKNSFIFFFMLGMICAMWS